MIVLSNATIIEQLSSIQNLRSELLPPDAMRAFANVKLTAVQVSVIGKAYEGNASDVDKREVLKFLEFCALGLKEVAKQLFVAMNSVSAEKFDAFDLADSIIQSYEGVKNLHKRK